MLFQKIKICYVIISAVNVRTGACAYMDATGLLDATLLAWGWSTTEELKLYSKRIPRKTFDR